MSEATAQDKQAVLSLKHVGVNYGIGIPFQKKRVNRWVLEDISFDLYKGESLGVIGRNGIGKSTLLRVMAGITRPNRGEVKLKKGCRAALLSLSAGFMPELSGRENVFLSALLLGVPMAEIKRRYDDIVAFAELEEFIEEPVMTYSSGMKARLGFAIGMQIQPDILLIDEVLGVGDAAFREKSAEAMKARIRSDQTVVLVSHNATTIRQLCTRAVWIEAGITQAEGNADEVMGAYEAHIKSLKK